MQFKGFQKTSLIEYPGKIASIVWVAGCNFRCPFCYNVGLVMNSDEIESVSEEKILDHLKKTKDWTDALAITGGEPTLQKDLPEFIKKVKNMGLLVELETNSTNPDMLKQLIDSKMIDYIAMDIKAPLNFEDYQKATNIKDRQLFENIKKSIKMVMRSRIDYEFRLTVVPTLHTREKLIEIGKQLNGAKKFYLQQFKNDVSLMDESFEKIEHFSRPELDEFCKRLKRYFKECKVRA